MKKKHSISSANHFNLVDFSILFEWAEKRMFDKGLWWKVSDVAFGFLNDVRKLFTFVRLKLGTEGTSFVLRSLTHMFKLSTFTVVSAAVLNPLTRPKLISSETSCREIFSRMFKFNLSFFSLCHTELKPHLQEYVQEYGLWLTMNCRTYKKKRPKIQNNC